MTDKPMNMSTKAGRDAELLAQLEIDGGISVAWLAGNRSRTAALRRLVVSGRLVPVRSKDTSVLPLGRPKSILRRLLWWLK